MHRRRFSRKSIAMAGLIMTGAMVAGEAAQSADFTRPPVCAAPLEPWTEINLYFGRDITGVGEVTEQQFRAFAREVVTPRFPDGLTILDALGQFRDGQRIVRERAKLLVLLVPDRNDIAAEVAQIVREYKRRFRQQSVLRTETQLCLSFA